MSDESDMLRQIEQHEAWLRQAMPPLTPPSMEPLKLRIRVAVHEAWLAGAGGAETPGSGGGPGPGPDLASVKSAVRGEIVRRRRRRLLRRGAFIGGGLAAAAAVMAALLPGLRSRSPLTVDWELAASQRLACFAEALADAVPGSDETASEWDLLESEIITLEDTLADGSATEWNALEIDDLGGELDALAEQLGQGSS